MASTRCLVSLILLVVLVFMDIADSSTSTVLDISDVIFANSTSDVSSACISDYPDVEVSSVTTDSARVDWVPLSAGTSDLNLTGYQILYWEFTNTLYNNVTVGVVDQHTLTTLKPFTRYFVSVRGVCQDNQYGVASMKEDIFTVSTFPSGDLGIVSVETSNDSAIIVWSELSPDDWHGIMQGYVLVIADITPGFSTQNEESVPYNQTSAEVGGLRPDHSYIVTVSARSSGGLGVPSEPYFFKIEKPPPPATQDNENLTIGQVWYYLAVPAGVLLAICATVVVILCKINYDRKKKCVYAREIAGNMDENNKFMGRMDSIRMSNRPLPAYPAESPHPRTPSVSSMSAHLIDQTTTSPNQFHHGMSFSSADQHHFHHHHQSQPSHQLPPLSATQHPHPPHHHPPPELLPLDLDPPAHHQFRSHSVSSPQMPQLSQPLSDLSSATPSSVFTESNVPQMDENPSSPNLPKAYEVPSDSKTCHQSGGSPVMGHNTLPNPRRPHTATGVMASQPVLSPHPQSSHSPISLTHSSSDVRNNHGGSFRPPDIPPHRMNSFGHQQQRPHQVPMVIRPGDVQPPTQGLTRPESGLYSEVASDPAHMEGNFVKNDLGQHSLPHNDGSIISSDQYSDYSDIPDHIVPGGGPIENHTSNTRHKLPSLEEEEYRKENRLSSESMSSFSSDSQSSSPAHSKVSDVSHHHLQLNKMNSGRPSHVTIQETDEHDYDECNSVITDNSSSVNTKVTLSAANPYLSPVDIVPSSNGHHQTPPSD